MLRRQILAFARRATSRRKIDNEHAVLRQPVEIAHDARADLVCVVPARLAVPALERLNCAILPRRSLEIGRHLPRRGHHHLLPGPSLLSNQHRRKKREDTQAGDKLHGVTPQRLKLIRCEVYVLQATQVAVQVDVDTSGLHISARHVPGGSGLHFLNGHAEKYERIGGRNRTGDLTGSNRSLCH